MQGKDTTYWEELEGIIKQIAKQARALKDEFTNEIDAPISYCCVFCQNNEEFNRLAGTAASVGHLAQQTPPGPVYIVPGIKTGSGLVHIIKIRRPDPARPELGYADFAAMDYAALRKFCQGKPEFKIIQREKFEMIELMKTGSNVRVYFSNPPVEQHSGIREALTKYS